MRSEANFIFSFCWINFTSSSGLVLFPCLLCVLLFKIVFIQLSFSRFTVKTTEDTLYITLSSKVIEKFSWICSVHLFFYHLSSFTASLLYIPPPNIVLFKEGKKNQQTHPGDNLHNMLMLICIQTSGWHFNISFSFRQVGTTQMGETILRALL